MSYIHKNLSESVLGSYTSFMDFPGNSAGKESDCNAGDPGSIPGLGRSPGGEHGNPLQYSCLENPHEWRNLEGYSPWDHKELDMTELLSAAQYTSFIDCNILVFGARNTHISSTNIGYSCSHCFPVT